MPLVGFSQYWQQQGQDIDSEAAGDQFGISVSVNATGDRVAIGANGNNGNSGILNDYRGHVRIYKWNGSSWTQQGQDIDGEAAGDQSGYSVSMNAAGDRVAIGAHGNDANGTKLGERRGNWDTDHMAGDPPSRPYGNTRINGMLPDFS